MKINYYKKKIINIIIIIIIITQFISAMFVLLAVNFRAVIQEKICRVLQLFIPNKSLGKTTRRMLFINIRRLKLVYKY